MSEYQYYEFRAVDRDLTPRQMDELRRLSTRAEITPTSFTNFYTFGDFRGDPDRMVEKYFDAFVYVANWGTHRLMLRLPWKLLEAKTVRPYCVEDFLDCRTKGQYTVLEFVSEDESGDWEEGDEWMDLLLPLREELLDGDLRGLYLGWLSAVRVEVLDEETIEPPPPPGLGTLSPGLEAMVEFLRIDPDLVAAAAESSVEERGGPSHEELTRWIGRLPKADKDALLLRVAEGKEKHVHSELMGRFRDERKQSRQEKSVGAKVARRTVRELLAIAEVCRQERIEREARHETARKKREDRKLAAARKEVLDFLAGRADENWRQVEKLLQTGSAKQYDKAASLAADLRDALAQAGRQKEFETRFHQLHTRHARKRSFIKRLAKLGLIADG